jgi:hypothetical protein
MSFLNFDIRESKPLVYSRNNKDCKNVLLIHSLVKDSQLFFTSANSSTMAIIYSSGSTKTELLDLLKSNFTAIQRIAICFTSGFGTSKTFLDNKSFFESENVDFLVSLIKELGVKNIDFLGCNTLNYSNWTEYYKGLTVETGVIVGASSDKTGNIKYGGDWIMESTSENVEAVYFTKGIRYYSYLLDTYTPWATGLEYIPFGLAIYEGYMYVCNIDNGSISKIKLDDPNSVEDDWATGLDTPYALAIHDGYIYVSNYSDGTNGTGFISKINLAYPNNVYPNVVTGLYGPTGLAIHNGYIYVSIFNGDIFSSDTPTGLGNIIKIDLDVPNTVEYNWATGLNLPFGLAIYDGYIYVSNLFSIIDENFIPGNISKIDLDDPNSIEYNWATGLNVPFGLAIYDGYIYVSNNSFGAGGSIGKINLTNPNTVYPNLANELNSPLGLAIYNGYIYVGTGDNSIYRFLLPPIAPICFPRGTPIQTDQGLIAIDKIDNTLHSINNKPIVSITQTITDEPYLVCFEKHSLGYNYPSQKTIMSKQHRVFFNGSMIPAHTFIGNFKNIKKVKYNGELLYNVLMNNHSTMKVNNMLCETLDPNHKVAKLYRNKNIQ